MQIKIYRTQNQQEEREFYEEGRGKSKSIFELKIVQDNYGDYMKLS